VLYGATNPVAGTGVDGNFYINTTTDYIFGPKAAGAWPAGASLIGPQGPQGTQGVAGNTILYSAADPSSGQGVDGNFYINTTSHFLFGPKAGGAWPAGTSLVGPQGIQGPQGVQGVAGAGSPSTIPPLMDSTAAVGTSTNFSREDHIHPSDTSRYAASNPNGYQTAAQVSASLGSYLPLIGGTLTGTLNGTAAIFSGSLQSGSTIAMQVATAGIGHSIQAKVGANNRWAMLIGDGGAESGSNAGSNFSINNYTDAGAPIGAPFQIIRSNGLARFSGYDGTVLGAFIAIDGPASQQRGIAGTTSGSERWNMLLGSAAAESGGNAGSNFVINSYSDAGGYLASPLQITRSSGVAAFSQPIVNGSDRRIKSNIEPITQALSIVAKLQGVFYRHQDAVRRQVGLVAQDVIGPLPEVVFDTGQPQDAQGNAIDGEPPMLGIAYPNMVAVLIEAIKELASKVAELEARPTLVDVLAKMTKPPP
jgi:hypothetical protein